MRSKLRIWWGRGKLKAAGNPHPAGHGIKANGQIYYRTVTAEDSC